MSTPFQPAVRPGEPYVGDDPAMLGSHHANFVIGLAGFVQLILASLGAFGVYAYAAAPPSHPEAYQANVAAVAVFPLSIALTLVSAIVCRSRQMQISKPVRRWSVFTSLLPLLMVIVSFVVPIFFDGPPMF